MDGSTPVDARPKTTRADLFFAPVVGGEYAFSRRFAVGAEVQLPITVFGDRSATTRATTDTPNAGQTLATNTVLFLRYFF